MAVEGLYQRIYDEELSWRDQLSTAIGIPVAVTTVLGGILAFYAESFTAWTGAVGWWFGLALLGGTLCFVSAIVQLVRARWGYSYERVPFPSQIRTYEKQLRTFHAESGTPAHFQEDFDEWLNERLVAAADRNLQNDVEKSHHLHWAVTWLLGGLAATGLAAPPYFLSESSAEAEVVKVEVVGIESLFGGLQNGGSGQFVDSINAAAGSGRDAEGSGAADSTGQHRVQGRSEDP